MYIMQKLYTIAVMKSLCHNEKLSTVKQKVYPNNIAISFPNKKFYTVIEKSIPQWKMSKYPNRKV